MKFDLQKKQLREVVNNLWSSWDNESKQLFEEIDQELYEKYSKNPYYLMQEIDEDKLKTF